MPESVTDRPTSAHEHVFLLTKKARYFYDAVAVREPLAASSVQRLNQPTFDQQTGGPKDYAVTAQNASRSARKALENLAAHQSTGANKRDIWAIATQSYTEAHFATFPEKLVEPCIRAGTSAHGVCGDCGAPWERRVDVQGRRGHDYRHGDPLTHGKSTSQSAPDITRTTTGWKPTCDHDASVQPATVIDPFCGSGTTGVVALRHNRSFIGIELNPEYVELARQRIIGDAPMLNQPLEGGIDP